MVLLEKLAGNVSINKLCAISLLEADFNWVLKVMFAPCMMQRMHANNVILLEQGAVKGKLQWISHFNTLMLHVNLSIYYFQTKHAMVDTSAHPLNLVMPPFPPYAANNKNKQRMWVQVQKCMPNFLWYDLFFSVYDSWLDHTMIDISAPRLNLDTLVLPSS